MWQSLLVLGRRNETAERAGRKDCVGLASVVGKRLNRRDAEGAEKDY